MGVGGVGGYFGGKLADRYRHSDAVEVIFLARGENENAIKKNGLKIITPKEEIVAYPSIVSSDVTEIGKLDFILCTLKAYDLEAGLKQYQNSVDLNTILLPLLNGVGATAEIKKAFPANEVWEGFSYIVVRLLSPGIIKESGTVHSMHFGSDSASEQTLNSMLTLFKNASIDAYYSKEIVKEKWEKFLFISAMATVTSYLDLSIGQVLQGRESRELWMQLLYEAEAIARIKNIGIDNAIIDKAVRRAEALPFDTTSSMHNDFKSNKPAELNALTAYIVQEGKLYNLPTPTYEMMLARLEKKMTSR